jgi:3-oxo-5-alpha-steroid 4-dehydrogenase 3
MQAQAAIQLLLMFGVTGLVLVSCLEQHLKPLLQYGKTVQVHEASMLQRISLITVPKRFFKHFYIKSTLLGILCLMTAATWPKTDTWSRRTALVNLACMLTHSLRRLHESVSNSKSPMWIGHYLAGLFFYTMVNLSMLFEAGEAQYGWAICFFAAQGVQHHVHRQLEGLRRACKPGTYANPKGGLFEYVVAPHYTAEIMLYLSLALMNRTNLSLWLVFLWTLLILSASVKQTDHWGRMTFSDWKTRPRLIPLLF